MAQTQTSQSPDARTERRGRRAAPQHPPNFDGIYRRYRPDLVRFARRRGAEDPEGVADLALHDLARAYSRLRSTEPPVLQAYLYKAARSRAARNRAAPAGTVLGLEELEDVPSGAFEEIVARNLDLDSLLSMLSESQEEALRLRFFEHMTSAEAAAVMNVDAVTVRTHQRRGLTQLRHLVLAGLVAAVIAAGLVVAFRGAEPDRIFSEPVAPNEGPRGGSQPTVGEESDPAEIRSDGSSEQSSSPVDSGPSSSDVATPAEGAPRATIASTPGDGGGWQSTTIPVLPGVEPTTAEAVLPGVEPSAIPVQSGGGGSQSTTTIPVLPGVEVSTIPVLPGVEVSTIPVLPGYDSPTTTIPVLPGVEQSTIPVLPGVEPTTTTIPVLPGYDSPTTTIPVLPGVEQSTIPILSGDNSATTTTIPAQPGY